MKKILLICLVSLAGAWPAWSVDEKDRFLEILEDHDTLIYDANTVQTIAPGRFTISHTITSRAGLSSRAVPHGEAAYNSIGSRSPLRVWFPRSSK